MQEKEQNLIIQNCCRICLTEKTIMVNILDGVEGFDGTIMEMTESSCGIKIDENDDHSKLICDICLQELLITVKFREKCKKSEEILSSISLKFILEYGNENENSNFDVNLDMDSTADKENCLILNNSNDINNVLDEQNLEQIKSNDEEIYEKIIPDNIESEYSNEIEAEEDEDEEDVDDFNDESNQIIKEVNYIDLKESDNAIKSSLKDEDLDSNSFENIEYLITDIKNEDGYFEICSLNDSEEKNDSPSEEKMIFLNKSPRKWKKKRTDDPSTNLKTNMTTKINYSCEKCGAGFTHLMNLQRHLVSVHQVESNDISTCSMCSLTFTSTDEFKLHIETHKDETDKNNHNLDNFKLDEKLKKRFACPTCDKRFVSKSTLKSHERIHTGEKPYTCKICSKKFGTISGFDLHQRRHSGYRPYKCTYCDRGFVETSNLRAHMRTHTGEKPHVCTVCSKAFSRVFLLQLHLRTHTGEKPYTCTVCWKSFAQQSDLTTHTRIHTGERPHKCHICNKGYIKSSGLHSHLRRHDKA